MWRNADKSSQCSLRRGRVSENRARWKKKLAQNTSIGLGERAGGIGVRNHALESLSVAGITGHQLRVRPAALARTSSLLLDPEGRSQRDGLLGPKLEFTMLVLFGPGLNLAACNAPQVLKKPRAHVVDGLRPIDYAPGRQIDVA